MSNELSTIASAITSGVQNIEVHFHSTESGFLAWTKAHAPGIAAITGAVVGFIVAKLI